MYTITKEGQQSSANTHEYICDTDADLNEIKNAPFGSKAVILEPFDVQIMGSDGWKSLG